MTRRTYGLVMYAAGLATGGAFVNLYWLLTR